MKLETVLAWCVHLYTALGLVLAALMAVLIVRGGDGSFRAALGLMLLATLIDSTDGWLARRARVKQLLPGFDGRRLDDIVDFHTYTSLPLLLLWRAEVFQGTQALWLLVPLLASAYGFAQAKAKTDEGFFQGFPSYWNVVAFYLYFWHPPVWLSLAIILALALLTFVPSLYLYPSQRTPYSRLTILLASVWALLLMLMLLRATPLLNSMLLLSLAFPLYYMALSWIITLRRWRTPGSGANSVHTSISVE